MPDSGREKMQLHLILTEDFLYQPVVISGGEHKQVVIRNLISLNIILRKIDKRGNLPAKGRENAISFVIGNKGYIGLGDDDYELMNDLWCFEP